MRHIKLFIISLFVVASLNANAQKERVRGIYKSSEDFIKGELSFDNNCTTKKIKIKLNDFFVQPYITIKQGDSSIKLLKNDIFGYRNCKDQIFRFKNKQELLLLNAGDQILIYKIPNNKPPPGSRTNVTNYFFSIGGIGSLQKLTIKNLKAAFSDNKKFQQLIDNDFKYNTDLAVFDEVKNIYKINLLLKESLR